MFTVIFLKKIEFRLQEDLLAWINEHAIEQDLPVSEILQDLVRNRRRNVLNRKRRAAQKEGMDNSSQLDLF